MLRKLDTPKRTLDGRERSRRARARARDGDAVFQVTASHDAVVLMLLESGTLTEQDALDRHRVNSALSGLFQHWLLHWRDLLRPKNS
jgi:hypothetical protein